jgi:proton glutamate symport protein
MGLALGLSRSEASGRLLEVVEGVYETFFKILNWVLYALPLGLFCLIGGHIAAIGSEYLLALGKITGIFYVCCLFMAFLYLMAMRVATGLSIGGMFKALRDPLALAFVSSNSLVAMPMALRHLEEDLHQSHDLVRLVVPLGIVMNRHAYPLLFSFMTVYVSQVYDHPLGILQLLQVSVASAMIGMAAIGPAASVAPLLALILLPLGLPAGLAVATLVETTALVTPIVAMTHLFGSCATATLIGAGAARRKAKAPAR